MAITRSTTKLTEAALRDVRARYIPRHPEHGARAMAREYGVHRETVQKAVWGITWRDIGWDEPEHLAPTS